MTTDPSLSVILLCWNHSQFLERCIASIANQGLRPTEIVFLDNSSSDDSCSIAEAMFEKFDLNVKIIKNRRPLGIAENLNLLLKQTSCDLVAPLSTDDWYSPDYVHNMCITAKRDPDVGMIATNGWWVDDTTGEKSRSTAPSLQNEFVGDEFLYHRDFLFWVGICYRRVVLDDLGGWDEDQSVEDIDLIYRLTKNYRITQVPDHLVYYRRSNSSISLNPIFMTEGRLRFYNKHKKDFGRRWRPLVAETLRSGAAVAIDQNKKHAALILLAKSLIKQPFKAVSWRTVLYLLRTAMRRSR